MEIVRAYLRSLDPRLSRPLWTLLSGSLANANVRGIGLGTAGLILAASSETALVAGPVSGSLIEHVGPRQVLVASMVLSGIGGGFALPLVRFIPPALRRTPIAART